MSRRSPLLVIWMLLFFGCGQETEPTPKQATQDEPKLAKREAAQNSKLENEKLEKLGAEYLDKIAAESPVFATWLGDHRFDSELDQVTKEARKESLALYKSTEKKLSSIDKSALTKNNQIDYLLLKHQLASSIWAQTELREWEWNPLVYTSIAGSGIYNLMAREFAPIETRLERVADRLEKYPALFEQIRKTLKAELVPQVHAKTAVKQNPGVLSIIDNTVAPHLETLPKDKKERLQTAINNARKSVDNHQQWLEKELLPNAKGDFRLGSELYDKKLAFALNSDLDRKAIKEQALAELKRVRGEMYAVARKLVPKNAEKEETGNPPSRKEMNKVIREGLEMAYKDAPKREEVLSVAKKGLKMATDFVREKDLVTLPDDPVEVIVMPEFQRGVALAYCDSPGPLDAGQKTFYAVAPLPEEWTTKQVNSYLREYNTRSVYELTLHEAMPGHFLQLAHSNQFPSKLRAVLSSGVFIEGWAIYSERVMWQEGFLDGDPLLQLIAQKWLLRAISNAIIDQGVHTGDMTEEEAMKIMVEDTFQEEREAAGKWTRARLTSAQLSTYFVGIMEHTNLRKEVEKAKGEEFSLKEYHDEVISYGSPPTRYVRAMILDKPITK